MLPLLKIFATPLGALINKGISMGAAALVATSVAHGNPIGDVSNIVSLFAMGLSTLISGFAATQGVTIPVINESDNGVVVVPTSQATASNIAPVSSPLK